MERGVRLGHRFRRATVALLAGAMLVGGCSTASTGAPEGSSSPSQAAPTATATEPTVSATAANELNALLPQAVREKGVLILGTDAEYPPCEYYDESGEMVGFEPDLWNAIGEKLGVEVKPESISFDGLMPGVESGRFDAAMECIADRPEREEKYTFVDFYYGAGGIVTLTANPKGVSEDPLSLCGLAAGVQTGTDFVEQLAEIFSPHCTKSGKAEINVTQFPQESQVLLAIQSGRVDFMLADLAAGAYLAEQSNGELQIFGNELFPKVYEGFVTRKDDAEMQQALLKGVESIIADGTYDSIMAKWGIEYLSLKEPGINLATTRPIEDITP